MTATQPRGRVFAVLAAALTLLCMSVAVAATRTPQSGRGHQRALAAEPSTIAVPRAGPAATSLPAATTAAAPATTLAPTTSRPPELTSAPIGPVALTGCPPPPRPRPPAVTPSHPSVLVPESALPAPPQAAPKVKNLAAISGKGMWIWMSNATEGGNVDAIVRRAAAAHLTELWVRVGDSFDGFYGAGFLNSLVPAAHSHGLAVIGWGFPYLYDPVRDADWSIQALAWQAPTGDRLDGWSGDIEAPTEGVALSAVRAALYLALVRPHIAGRPLVATVYPPTAYWLANYPYRAIAPYIDAFAPMLYWSCTEPGADAAAAIAHLVSLAPVHVIGQAFDMAPYGGRVGSPSGAEIARFLDVARRDGAVGGSFWVWQDMTGPEWSALTSYSWPGR